MTDPRMQQLASRLAAVILIAAAGIPATATARDIIDDDIWVIGYVGFATGYRHSVTLDSPGFDIRFCAGGFMGPVGVEFESGATSDHTFMPKEDRTAMRGTNWLSFQMRIAPLDPLWFSFGGGPGLGYIRRPSDGPGHRKMSYGVHEYFDVNLAVGDEGPIPTFVIRFEPQHLWQDEVISGVEHAVTIHLRFMFMGVWDD